MGSISARKLHQVIENVEKILGIELFCAAQAIDYHAPLKPGEIIQAVHNFVRTKINHLEEDQIMYEKMQIAIEMVKQGDLLKVARKAAKVNNLSF